MSRPLVVGATPLPANVSNIARRLMLAAMRLEEDANNCAGNPVPPMFDDMLRSMAAMRETLIQATAEIAVG